MHKSSYLPHSVPTVDEYTRFVTLNHLRRMPPASVRTILQNNLREVQDADMPTTTRLKANQMVGKCLRVKAEADARRCRALIVQQKAKLRQLQRGY